MITITCFDGPWPGRERHFVGTSVVEDFSSMLLGEEMDPTELFTSMVQHGWAWEVDYSQATDEEQFLWFRAELVCRVVRALQNGLPVHFMDREYWVESGQDGLEAAGRLEDDIVDSGKNVTIISDDENGLVIGTIGYEQ